MAVGYFWSILAMMSAPFLLVALVGGLIYKSVRSARLTSETQ